MSMIRGPCELTDQFDQKNKENDQHYKFLRRMVNKYFIRKMMR